MKCSLKGRTKTRRWDRDGDFFEMKRRGTAFLLKFGGGFGAKQIVIRVLTSILLQAYAARCRGNVEHRVRNTCIMIRLFR